MSDPERCIVPSKRRLRWALLPVGIAAAVVLAGCTPTELNGYLPGLRRGRRAHHGPHRDGVRTLGQLVDRAPRRRRRHVGPDGLGGDRLPPPQGPGRPPRAAALQHADRDLLHDRAAHPRGRLLRLHRARPDDPRDAVRRPGRLDHRDRQAVVVGLPVQRRDRRRHRLDRWASRRSTDEQGTVDQRAADARTCRSTRRSRSSSQSRDVIHSFWIIDFLYKKDMYIGRDNYWSFTPTREGDVRRPSAPSCAASTTRRCSSTSRS